MSGKINRFIYSHVILSAFLLVMIFVSVYSLFYIFTAESPQQLLQPGYVTVFSVWQLFMSALIVWAMRKTEVFDISDFKLKGLGKGLLLAWFPILLSIESFFMLLLQLPDNSLIKPNILHVLAFVLHTLCIGIFEETLIRGLTLKLLLKKMGSSKKGIIVACIVSSILFGISHITNLFLGDSLVKVIGQIFSTTAIGFYFAVLFLRTRTLWVPILVHMLVNLSSYIFNVIVSYDVLVQRAQASANIESNIANRVLLIVVFSIAGWILFRKVKPIADVNENP